MVQEAQKIEVNRRPVITIISIGITGFGNFLAWFTLIWTIFVADSTNEFDYIYIVIAGYLLPVFCFIGLLFVIGGTLRKESNIQLRRLEPEIRLRRLAYIVSLLSFPLFLFVVVLFL